MKVSLITHTPEPLRLLYAQTRMTTTSDGFAAVYDRPFDYFPKKVRLDPAFNTVLGPEWRCERGTQEMRRLVGDALTAGHWSVSRGVSFTFSIECSRSTGRQLLRHVVGVGWEEMSQRYVKVLNRSYLHRVTWQTHAAFSETTYTPEQRARAWTALLELVEQVFEIPSAIIRRGPDDAEAHGWFSARAVDMQQYLDELDAGIPAEDARANLPECTLTQMACSWSFEALKTFMAKRLCTRAQAPIRAVAKAMRKEIARVDPWLAGFLTIQCLPACICPETNPGTCPLLADHGGSVLRQSQALDVVRSEARRLRETRTPVAGR